MHLYGLIGFPLGHSFSKQYFNEKFEREGIKDCLFEAFPIESIDLFPQLLKAHPQLKGLSVTIPYKEQVLPFINILSEEVQFIGATNSIKISEGILTAYNTDITGFQLSFSSLLKPHHTKALILGSGGAAKAVQYVLRKMGIEFLTVTRNKNLQDGFISYQDIGVHLLDGYNIIINCSPAGMSPNEHTYPDIPYHLLHKKYYLYDLVYKPDLTLFLQKGAAQGAVIKNGYDMLLIQAEASWKIWNS